MSLSELHQACKKGDSHKVTSILATSPHLVDQRDTSYYDYTGLHYACEKGHVECVNLLISSGADINIETSDGWTGLRLACYHNHHFLVIPLLSAGCHPDTGDSNNMSPLMIASSRGHVECVAALLTRKESIDLALTNTLTGWTALHWACCNNHLAVVRELLGLQAAPEVIAIKDKRGRTPLDCAR